MPRIMPDTRAHRARQHSNEYHPSRPRRSESGARDNSNEGRIKDILKNRKTGWRSLDKEKGYLYDSIHNTDVELHVGCQGKKTKLFVLKRELLTRYSAYFRVACKRGKQYTTLPQTSVQGQPIELDIEDTNPKTFAMFARWIEESTLLTRSGKYPKQEKLVQLWLLADEFIAPKLQNEIVMALETRRPHLDEGRISLESITETYKGTPKGSHLRLYLAATFARFDTANIKNPGSYPKDFLGDVINALRNPSWYTGSRKAHFTEPEMRDFLIPNKTKSPINQD